MKILLDYAFKVIVNVPIAAASTSFLKQVCLVVKKNGGGSDGTIVACTSMAQVNAITDNDDAQQFFDAGMTKVFILCNPTLDLEDILTGANLNKFFTLVVSSDFSDADVGTAVTAAVKATVKIQDITYTAKTGGTGGNAITVAYVNTNTGGLATASNISNAISVSIESGVTTAATIAAAIAAHAGSNALVDTAVDSGDGTDPQVTVGATSLAGGVAASSEDGDNMTLGTFRGVVGVAIEDESIRQSQAAIVNRATFYDDGNGHALMCYAFGNLLKNPSEWFNQQYIQMPLGDDIDDLGEAESLFDDKVSFVLTDDEFGNRLALFVAGGGAITAPYIIENLKIDLQSAAVTWINANQPDYTLVDAALLETRLQDDVINTKYIQQKKWLSGGEIQISLVEDNFVADGQISVPKPKALWRVVNTLTQTP